MNLMDFYEDWIHQPGFLDFDVDKIVNHACGIYAVVVRQKGYGTNHLGTNVPVDVTLVSGDMEFSTTEHQLVSGDSTELMVLSSFNPAFVILDHHGKLNDATIDDTRKVAGSGNISFTSTYCSAQISQLSDTSLIHVEHHYVAPTAPSPLPEGYIRFSQTHYWTVNYAGTEPTGVWRFQLKRTNGQPDYNLLDGGFDIENLKLMYRPDGQSAWTPVEYTRTGSPYNSTITTTDMLAGQYCFAVAEQGVSTVERPGVRLSVYPNPADDTIILKTDTDKADKAVVFDSLGHKVKTLKISEETQTINVSNLSSGNYIIVLYRKGKSVARTMFVKA